MAEQHELGPGGAPLDAHVLEAVVETFKALSDPTRAQLVYLLTQGEYSVNELCEYVAVTPSAVSHHLAKLRAIRLARTRRAGNQIFYSVDDAHVAALFREALFHLDHVQRNLPDHVEYSAADNVTDSANHAADVTASPAPGASLLTDS